MAVASRTLVALSVALSGCGSKESVSLDAHIDQASVTVQSLALGTHLTGAFQLVLVVGKEATSGSTVSVEKFALQDASGATLADPLSFTPPDTEFTVAIGEKRVVPLTFDQPALLSDADRARVCAGKVRIVGAVTDTLSAGKTTPARSIDVAASGCP